MTRITKRTHSPLSVVLLTPLSSCAATELPCRCGEITCRGGNQRQPLQKQEPQEEESDILDKKLSFVHVVAAVVIQTTVRRFLAVRTFERTIQVVAAVAIQTTVRRFLAVRTFERTIQVVAAVIIQTTVRRFLAVGTFERTIQVVAAVAIQTIVRRFLAVRTFERMIEAHFKSIVFERTIQDVAAVVIQTTVRRFVAVRTFERITEAHFKYIACQRTIQVVAAVVIQTIVRRFLAVRNFERIMEAHFKYIACQRTIQVVAAVVIQTIVRRFLAVRNFERMMEAHFKSIAGGDIMEPVMLSQQKAVPTEQQRRHQLIQKTVGSRKIEPKPFRADPPPQNKQERIQRCISSAIVIQRIFRGWWARDSLHLDNYCAILLQKSARGFLAKANFYYDMYRIVLAQSYVRTVLARKMAAERSAFVVAIQSQIRGYLARKRTRGFLPEHKLRLAQYAAAAKIQACCRAFLVQERYLNTLADILIVQSMARRWIANNLVVPYLKSENIGNADCVVVGDYSHRRIEHTRHNEEPANRSVEEMDYSDVLGMCKKKKSTFPKSLMRPPAPTVDTQYERQHQKTERFPVCRLVEYLPSDDIEESPFEQELLRICKSKFPDYLMRPPTPTVDTQYERQHEETELSPIYRLVEYSSSDDIEDYPFEQELLRICKKKKSKFPNSLMRPPTPTVDTQYERKHEETERSPVWCRPFEYSPSDDIEESRSEEQEQRSDKVSPPDERTDPDSSFVEQSPIRSNPAVAFSYTPAYEESQRKPYRPTGNAARETMHQEQEQQLVERASPTVACGASPRRSASKNAAAAVWEQQTASQPNPILPFKGGWR